MTERLGSEYVATDWSDVNLRCFPRSLARRKMAMWIGIGLIVIVAALNIVASLILLVMEKTRDIASQDDGSFARAYRWIFVCRGDDRRDRHLVGSLLRALLEVFDRYRVIQIPRRLSGHLLAISRADARQITVVVGWNCHLFSATIYPSRQAARLDPVQALGFEMASSRRARQQILRRWRTLAFM